MTEPERVVFDCNVFFQALIAPSGPAGRALELVLIKRLSLFLTTAILDELTDVTFRPRIQRKFNINRKSFDAFVSMVVENANMMRDVPHVFDFERDPDDAHNIDLAVAANARLVVSRDKDLLSLRDLATEDARAFKKRFPEIEILTSPELIKRIEASEVQ